MKSRLYVDEAIDNKDRRFGSDTKYFPVRVELPDGRELNALFTEMQLEVAIRRAENNQEDIPRRTFLETLIHGKD